jgi:hypothetical protein
LDGWEKDDDPLAEHLKHSPDCGWAIVASIGKQHNELSEENPASERMVEARKATFSNLWPHEGKKGWKCKTKQVCYVPIDGWAHTNAICRWQRQDGNTHQHQKPMIWPRARIAI